MAHRDGASPTALLTLEEVEEGASAAANGETVAQIFEDAARAGLPIVLNF